MSLTPGEKLALLIVKLLQKEKGYVDKYFFVENDFSDSEDEREHILDREEFEQNRIDAEDECKREKVPMVHYAGEFDSNTTRFETLSNKRKIGVLTNPGDEVEALVGLALLRPLIDVPYFNKKKTKSDPLNPVEFFVSLIRLEKDVIEEEDYDPKVAARVNRLLDHLFTEDMIMPHMSRKTRKLLLLQILKREHTYWTFSPKTEKKIEYWTIEKIKDEYRKF